MKIFWLLTKILTLPSYISWEKILCSKKKYSDAINFDGLKRDGWSYSKINTSKVLYNDDDTSMVQVNFSRLDKDNEIILTGDVTYLLVNKDGNWKLKGGFSPNLATLGND